jgi:hypothetical protein
VRILNTVALFLAMVAVAASAAAGEKAAAAAGTQAAPAGAAPAQAAKPPTPASQEPAYYRIELAPSGSYVAVGALVYKGNAVVFHAYPDGNVMSLRKTDIRKVSPITAQEAAAPAKKDLVSIRDLPMQGGSGPPASGTGHAGPAGAAHPATMSPGSAVRPTSVGPAVVPVRDGLAITTAPPPD